MDNKELQKLTEDISDTYFNKPFRHQALFNDRLKTTGGRYLLTSHNIELNRKYLIEHGREELIGIIKHELCHYHLHLEGKGYKHRDRDFRALLQQVNAPRFCTPLKKKTENKKTYRYICTACGQQYIKKRAMNPDRYRCGKCRGKIKRIFS
ncbi:SprT family protein [Bacillus vallismortis]|uniref:Protein SprT-like n=1 Tax=Bacillus vallismortis TaxID=72361 RepID=A0AAP3FWH5_BACVA|nr:SprT family protein [Bacillus vallismortis]MCI3985680.1 SprT family protein [Bacillus vallismortis]MCI4136891.1 SprT family protein [Bacillus vallismortis]MCY7892257.1 SprT family protein [Bacillus vallismortis]MCY8318607.1 SprT family protein [Bacillus vallismortis]MCY8423677.1 SprT family protein [Bacillus vallismortis]